ncbi:Uncharacterized protein BP5553_02026 [Venustampulla echinocandica]|uniref:Extracellular serine-rich protein n=1 Tax=Venustampulla echinocandica TaxID=2656787 RepID=A0A370U2N9_9HELO|nr:Uncharacterized protein BP5553_02026 [Venustampulla echinocandica]RDL42047.1 Uncharacterized protein BP5553_02026 [Venustampulla echinocandica]
MLTLQLRACLALALYLPSVHGCNDNWLSKRATGDGAVVNDQSIVPKVIDIAPLVEVQLGQLTISANTSDAASPLPIDAAAAAAAGTVNGTVLVIARDKTVAYSAYSGLNDHGIPYQLLIVPAEGAALPRLNDSATQGNYGLVVVLSEISYINNSTGQYHSALTDAQWNALYNYQLAFGVRMVRLDVAPSIATGTASLGTCCSKGNQTVSISNDKEFTTAGLKTGAGVSTAGLWHYPANITDASIATEFAQFSAAAADGFKTKSTAGVINRINGREQMVFFIGFSTGWSLTSNLLQHAWINWGTRGLYAGYRRAMMSPQIDDMFLETPIFDNPTENFRLTAEDMEGHLEWLPTLTKKLNAGSDWFLEVGHNGNGNIESVNATDTTNTLCNPGPIEYPDQIDTPLEFTKPLGSGTNLYPATPTAYPKYSRDCTDSDDLLWWWEDTTNLNAFAHLSHTFTHQDENNATYSDVYKEITWNKAWLDSVGISAAEKFSASGIIPPAITGMHNGDAVRAWADSGIKHVVGDNTRPVLMNQENEHWPLISTVESNGYAGIQITPRWASNIYYNCDLPACTTAEWEQFSAGKGNYADLLVLERDNNVRHLLGLHHDPHMFHQANLRWADVEESTVNGRNGQYSLLMAWTETVVVEFVRLVKWPLVSQKHDDLAATFMSRMNRDACRPNFSWTVDSKSQTITGVTVGAIGNRCKEKIPLTLPGPVTSLQGATKEQRGSDPLTLWVTLSGKPVTFTLATPIPLSAK